MTDFIDVVVIMFVGVWLFLPALVPNSAAALVGKKSRTKMDFGKSWRGKRIFGDGKSWLGFFGGATIGVIVGLIMLGIAALFGAKDDYWGYGPFWTNIGVIVCLSFGSLLGDLCGAFIKRRLGMERGQKAPILDQYDFVAGSLLLTFAFFPNFIIDNYIEGWHIAALIFVLLITFFLHRGVNIIGYMLGVKKEPW